MLWWQNKVTGSYTISAEPKYSGKMFVSVKGKSAVNAPLRTVHPLSACGDRVCIIHRPTNHHMSDWPLIWREDRGIFERVCGHGISHPDPDQGQFWAENNQEWKWVHGCDRCCSPRWEDKA